MVLTCEAYLGLSVNSPTVIQYCAKVTHTNFNEIPGFSGLFEEISLETIFQRNFQAFS